MLPLLRTRLALALVACVGVALELALMRGLAIRFSSHFAGIVISIGLLGFGAAGSLLTLFRNQILHHQRTTLIALAFALAISVPLTWSLAQFVPLNLNYLAWSTSEFPHVLALELLMLLPFAFAGAFIGIALMDTPARISGHYASDLAGSAVGGIAAVLLMNILPVSHLLITISLAALLAAFLLLRKSRSHAILSILSVALTASLLYVMPPDPRPNQYKPLYVAKLLAGTQTLFTSQGPLGRLDVVQGPNLHAAPQLSLQYFEDLPPHAEIYTDGDGPSILYDCKTPADWVFADFRTAALPFHMLPANTPPKVCILGAGGGVDIGLALYHKSQSITALEPNPQLIDAMTGPLAGYGGTIYQAPTVTILHNEPRGFFAATTEKFDIIEFPPLGGFGAAGSDASMESYNYTIQSIRHMIKHLNPGGMLALTRGISTPPREELRAFDLAAQSLRAESLDPAKNLAMIRGSFSCTILISRDPLTPGQLTALRDFSRKKGFDLCYDPSLTFKEANPNFKLTSDAAGGVRPHPPDYGIYNSVDFPFYFSGPQALLSSDREKFLADYPFNISAPSDNQPYFFHTFRWSAYAGLKDKYGQGSHAFLEVSTNMLLVALAESILLAILLILLPLAPGIRTIRSAPRKIPALLYFLMIGLGFMLLEMSLVQKLVLYLAHPIYAAAVAISSFLLFAGLGSSLSKSWKFPSPRVIILSALLTICLAFAFLLFLDDWFSLTVSFPLTARCLVAAFTISPLAFAMGHFFPLGLAKLAESSAPLVPWCWAVNGFASVAAASAAPLLAMQFGFPLLIYLSIACYFLAMLLFPRLTPTAPSNAPPPAAHWP